jgi:hypothetical protein
MLWAASPQLSAGSVPAWLGWTMALAWLASPLPLLPWLPARITLRFGPPMPPVDPLARVDAAVCAEAALAVEAAVRAAVDGGANSVPAGPGC